MDEFGKEVQRFETFTARCVFSSVCLFFRIFLFGDVGATYTHTIDIVDFPYSHVFFLICFLGASLFFFARSHLRAKLYRCGVRV